VKILGFDTATRATTVALLDCDSGAVLERRDDPPSGVRPRHTTRLMGLVVEVLDAAEAGWEHVDRIAVGVGPGTFTGLRVGVATAHALARAREIPLVGVSTLHALARGAAARVEAAGDRDAAAQVQAAGDRDAAVMAVIDARRGEVFAAGWALDDVLGPDAQPVLSARALPPDALAAAMEQDGRAWLAVGDGTVEFKGALERSGARIPEPDSELHRVSAAEHCRLAWGLRPEPPENVQPEYLRLPDAEITLRARQK
jgi:tRNA threonylcarbamoyladenosine biosynthesis protein TsaB